MEFLIAEEMEFLIAEEMEFLIAEEMEFLIGSWVNVTENEHENRMHRIHFGIKRPPSHLLALFSSSRTRPLIAEEMEFLMQIRTIPFA